VAQLCVDNPTLDNPYCAGINRDPDTGFIIGFTVRPANVASFKTEGLDVTLDWLTPSFAGGDLKVQLVGGFLNKLDFVSVPGAEVNSDLEEQYFPKFSATFDASWTKGALTLAYGVDWYTKTDRFTREVLAGDPDYSDPRYFRVKQKWDHHINVGFDVGDHVNVYAGINNLFDEKPAFGYPSYPVSAMGRYFYAGATMNFGAAGK
jgi:outer membrane receptor protein involved in Fe transport